MGSERKPPLAGTDLGLSYSGSYTLYDRKSVPTGVDQSFLMGVSHRLTRHILFSARESAGVFTRNYTGGTLSQSVQFDPSQSNIPTSDFFDNRTIFLTSQANMTIREDGRLSFNLGGNSLHERSSLSGAGECHGHGGERRRAVPADAAGYGGRPVHLQQLPVFAHHGRDPGAQRGGGVFHRAGRGWFSRGIPK